MYQRQPSTWTPQGCQLAAEEQMYSVALPSICCGSAHKFRQGRSKCLRFGRSDWIGACYAAMQCKSNENPVLSEVRITSAICLQRPMATLQCVREDPSKHHHKARVQLLHVHFCLCNQSCSVTSCSKFVASVSRSYASYMNLIVQPLPAQTCSPRSPPGRGSHQSNRLPNLTRLA